MYRQRREQTYFTITGLYSYDNTLFDNLSLPESMDKNTLITEILMTAGLLECAYPDGSVMKNIIGVWSFARKPDWQRMIDALYGNYNPLHNYDRTEDSTGENLSGGNKNITQQGASTEKEIIVDNAIRTFDENNLQTNNLTEVRTPNLTDTRTDNLTESHNGGEINEHYNTAYDSGLSVTSKDVMSRDSDMKKNTGTQSTTHSGTESTANTGEINNSHTGTITDDRNVERNTNKESSEKVLQTDENTVSSTSHLYARGNIGVTSTQQLIEQEINIRYEFNIYEIIAKEFKEKFCNLMYIL